MENFKVVQNLTNKIENFENQQRRNNLIITGIKEQLNESWAKTEGLAIEFLKQKFDLEPEIERAHRLGEKKDRDRPIILKLAHYKEKQMILNNAYKLKNSGCYINEDFGSKTREERAKLVKFAKTKHPGKKFKLKVNRLLTDGKKFEVGHVGIIEIK